MKVKICNIYYKAAVPTVRALAGLALSTRANLGTNTDPIANLELRNLRTNLDDFSNDFVASDDKLCLERTPTTRDSVVVLKFGRNC